jgi:hypothetical protein
MRMILRLVNITPMKLPLKRVSNARETLILTSLQSLREIKMYDQFGSRSIHSLI